MGMGDLRDRVLSRCLHALAHWQVLLLPNFTTIVTKEVYKFQGFDTIDLLEKVRPSRKTSPPCGSKPKLPSVALQFTRQRSFYLSCILSTPPPPFPAFHSLRFLGTDREMTMFSDRQEGTPPRALTPPSALAGSRWPHLLSPPPPAEAGRGPAPLYRFVQNQLGPSIPLPAIARCLAKRNVPEPGVPENSFPGRMPRCSFIRHIRWRCRWRTGLYSVRIGMCSTLHSTLRGLLSLENPKAHRPAQRSAPAGSQCPLIGDILRPRPPQTPPTSRGRAGEPLGLLIGVGRISLVHPIGRRRGEILQCVRYV
jgi:hypothetical protein